MLEEGVPNTVFVFCLAKGTKVPTKYGVKSIEDIVPGDQVYDLDGKTKVVKSVFDNGVREVVELKTTSGNTIHMTDDHEVQVVRAGQLVWSKVRDINNDDLIPISANKLLTGKSPLSTDEAELLGRIVGDGYYNQYHLGVMFEASEWEYGEALLKRVGLSYKPYHRVDKSVVECSIHAEGEHHWKTRWGLEDYTEFGKLIPSEVWKFNELQADYFMKGWRDADMNKSSGVLQITRDQLFRQAAVFAVLKGEIISAYPRTRDITKEYESVGVKKGTYEYNEIRQRTNRVIPFRQELADEVLSSDVHYDWKKDTAMVHAKTRLRQRMRGKGNFNISMDFIERGALKLPKAFYTELESVTVIGETNVYDIEVDCEDKSFIADGFSVHNCTTEELLKTIRSRSTFIEINTIAAPLIIEYIKGVAIKEEIEINRPAAIKTSKKSRRSHERCRILLEHFALAGEDALSTSYELIKEFALTCLKKPRPVDDIIRKIASNPIIDVNMSISEFLLNTFKGIGSFESKIPREGFLYIECSLSFSSIQPEIQQAH